MQRLWRWTLGSNVGFLSPASRYWWPPRRDVPLMASASSIPDQLLLLSRSAFYGDWSTRVKTEKKVGKDFLLRRGNKGSTDINPVRETTEEDTQDIAEDSVWSPRILGCSSHRDGTIYKNSHFWKEYYCVDVNDRNETMLCPMRRTAVTENCYPDPEDCRYHFPCTMMQIFSLKLAKSPIMSGSMQLYGYIAARDDLDLMLNYVFNRSRDDPIIVQQDSLIEMTGPKRGIALSYEIMFEFDMRIKNGEYEENDLQLIDGIIEFYDVQMPYSPCVARINGNAGAVDMCLTNIYSGVEATVQLVISRMANGFSLSLSCVVSMDEVRKEFQLFGGTIGEPRGLRNYVIAVPVDTAIQLKLKVGHKGEVLERCCFFEAKVHGCAIQQIDLEVASISVKVTWSTLE